MFLWDMVKIMILSSEGRVQLLAAQKPMNWPARWKGKFASFRCWQRRGWTDSSTHKLGRELLLAREGYIQEETAVMTLTIIFRFVISGLTSIIFVVLGTVNLQFRAGVFPFI